MFLLYISSLTSVRGTPPSDLNIHVLSVHPAWDGTMSIAVQGESTGGNTWHRAKLNSCCPCSTALSWELPGQHKHLSVVVSIPRMILRVSSREFEQFQRNPWEKFGFLSLHSRQHVHFNRVCVSWGTSQAVGTLGMRTQTQALILVLSQ